ncbi:MAG: hypothetical protein ACRD51_18010 [Candidatus Acidiferrum sp.]
MGNVKRLMGIGFAPFFIGLIGLFSLMERPRFAAYHNVDVLQLLGSGMCFGVALVGVIATIRGRRIS